MKKYRVDVEVKSVVGHQTIEVAAHSKEEALYVYNTGGGEFIHDDLEVQDSEEVSVDDFYVMNREQDIIDVARALINNSVSEIRHGGEWGDLDGYSCDHCLAETPDDPELINHDSSCPIITANRLLEVSDESRG